MIRGLSPNRVLERSFCTDCEKERQDWVSCIETVSQALGPGPPSVKPFPMHHLTAGSTYSPGSTAWMEQMDRTGTVSENMKMVTGTPICGSPDEMSIGSSPSSSHMDVDLSNKFQVQGVTHPRGSGKAKVVSGLYI